MKTKVLYDLKIRETPMFNDNNIISILPKNSVVSIISLSGVFFKHEYGWSVYKDETGMLIDTDEDIIDALMGSGNVNIPNKTKEIFLSSNDISLYLDINDFYSKYKSLLLKYPKLYNDLNNGYDFDKFVSGITLEEFEKLDILIKYLKTILNTNFGIVIKKFDDLLYNIDLYIESMNNNSISNPIKTKQIDTYKPQISVYATSTVIVGGQTTPSSDNNVIIDDAIDMSYFKEDKKDEDKNRNYQNKLKQLRGIFGIPYQYDEVSDPSYDGDNGIMHIGWKYYNTYLTRAPLLYLTPVRPKFLPGFSSNDKKNLTEAIFGNDTAALSFFTNESKSGARYFSTDFAFTEYMERFNTLCRALSIYLGIGDVKVDGIFSNPLKEADYREYILKSDVSTIFAGNNTLAYYVESIDSISETFTNETRGSTLEATLNSASDNVNELSFLLGSVSGTSDNLLQGMFDGISGFAAGLVDNFGNIGKRLGDGLRSISKGGKLILPEIWSDSGYDTSGGSSFSIKLAAQNPCRLGWFFDIGIPYMSLVTLVASHAIDANSYDSPFLVKAYCRSSLSLDMGIISSLDIKKGDLGKWTVDGLPTEVEINLEIRSLYSSFSTSRSIEELSTNTFCLDFLSNLAGLNVNKPSFERGLDLFVTGLKEKFSPFVFARYLGVKLEETANNMAFNMIGWITKK